MNKKTNTCYKQDDKIEESFTPPPPLFLAPTFSNLKNKLFRGSLRNVAWMSFCWSCSSLMVFSLLPIFIVEVLGASKTKLGFIEGVAIFTSFLFKVFAGVLSDYLKKRKPLILAGSLLSLLIKPMFALAASINWIFAARFIDRLSKGIRSSPTDALIADLSNERTRGKSFGLRQSLYTFGAVAGSLLASILMYLSDHNYRLVFMCAIIPSLLSIYILQKRIKAPCIKSEIKDDKGSSIKSWKISHIKYLPSTYWKVLAIVSVLMLARFSEAFLTLRARDASWPVHTIPLMIVFYDLIHASLSFPMGKLGDKFNKFHILFVGVFIFLLTHISLLVFSSFFGVIIGIILLGIHLGMTQSILPALVSSSVPSDLRGTAFALYYLVAGTSVLIGNWVAGFLSDTYGSSGPFYAGVFFTLLCLSLMICLFRVNKSYSFNKNTVS